MGMNSKQDNRYRTKVKEYLGNLKGTTDSRFFFAFDRFCTSGTMAYSRQKIEKQHNKNCKIAQLPTYVLITTFKILIRLIQIRGNLKKENTK